MTPQRIIITGATSGIGREVALIYIKQGWKVGIAGRRIELLESLKELAPQRIETAQIDITSADADQLLLNLIERLGGMDIYFHSSGIGKQNRMLNPEIEIRTLRTNGEGFVRMIDTAFNYFRSQPNGGHIAAISSIAGTKGLGSAPAYSATKRFQNTYLQCLAQLAHMEHLNIQFTDIRPGFVATDILSGSHEYPMLLTPQVVALEIVSAIKHKRRIRVIDWKYRILASLWRCIPDVIWERLDIHSKK